MELQKYYAEIGARLNGFSDFPQDQQQTSRDLFAFTEGKVTPKRFEVWTVLAGMPIPYDLQTILSRVSDEVAQFVRPQSRVYQVHPELLHWEIFILQRPDEQVAQEQLQEARNILHEVFTETPPIVMTYQGLVLNVDGTVLCKGYGEFEEVRRRLRERLPFASLRQSPMGHISLLRILDPVGQQKFHELRALVNQYGETDFGTMTVAEAKYVHETRWYMEEHEIVEAFPFSDNV